MVDYSLAAQVRPPQFADPIQTYAQMQQLQTNMLAAQRLRQQVESENQLRNLFQGGKFDLESPELASRIGAIDPDMAFKVLQAQRQAKLTQRQTEAAERQTQESTVRIAKANAELIGAQGDVFRRALGRVDLFPADQRAGVYQQLRDSLPNDIKRFYPAQYSPDVVQRGMMTTDQLIAAAKEVEPKYQQLPGDVPGEYIAGQGVRVLPVLPTPSGIPVGRGGLPTEQAGVPSYPVSAGRQAAMSAAAQRFAPELVGAAPAPAAAPVSSTQPPNAFGAPATNAMLQQPTTTADLAEQARLRAVELETQRTTARKQAEARVAREEALPKVQSSYVSATEAIDRQLRAIQDLEKRAGLTFATGPILGRTPNIAPFDITGAGGAQALIDQLKSATGLSALQDLRQNSPTGGALGSVSNEEGRRLENSVAALSQTQSTTDFRAQLGTLKKDLVRAKERLKEAFEREYKMAPPGAEPKKATNRAVQRTGVTPDGRRVVEYSDGTIDYAD